MLSVKLNGSFVELDDQFSMTINLKSPIFNDVGSSSYPFKIPVTPKNAIIMGFWHRIESTVDFFSDIPCEVYWKDTMIFIGVFKCTVSANYYEGSLYEGSGYFNYLRKKTSLQQIDFGSVHFEGNEDFFGLLLSGKDKTYPERNVNFPMITNSGYFDPMPDQEELYFFNFYSGKGEIDIWIQGGNTIRSLLVPMLYFRFVFNKIFEYLDYDLDDQFFSRDPDFNKLVIFNNVDCNEEASVNPPDNYFKYLIVHGNEPTDDLLYNYHLPRMNINEFLTGLENFFNIRIFLNNTTRTARVVSVDDIINSSTPYDFNKAIISITTELLPMLNGCHFKTEPDPNDGELAIITEPEQALIDTMQLSVDTIADLPIWPGVREQEIRYVIAENSYYYITKYTKVWNICTDIYTFNLRTQIIVRQIDKVISSSFSVSRDDEGVLALVKIKREDWAKIPVRLFFTRRNVGIGIDRLDLVTRGDNISLAVNGEKGLYNKYYKNYIEFLLNARTVNITKIFTHNELKEFDFVKKYQINGVNYLFSTIQVTLKMRSITPAKIKAYACR